MWQEQVRNLQEFHCLNVDLPGYGKSNQEEWVSVAKTADQVAEVIRTSATNQHAHIVALSLGAYVAQHLMARHPEQVDHVILSGVTAEPLPRPRVMLAMVRVMSLLMKNPLMIRLNAKMLHIPNEDFAQYAESLRAMSRQALLRAYDELLFFRPPEDLRRCEAPTLVVAGEMEMELVRKAVSTLAEMLPNAEGRIVPQVHHGWNGEAPTLFTAMVRAWLTDASLPDELAPATVPSERVLG
jgi:pimeloyl-ACP methyl ester carboxylesterase